jgi:hypothetical protein
MTVPPQEEYPLVVVVPSEITWIARLAGTGTEDVCL